MKAQLPRFKLLTYRINKTKFWNADKILSITAFLFSFGTFLLLVYQTHLIQKQQYASVMPYLETWYSRPTQKQFRFILSNTGIGPAFIKEVKVHYKGKTYIQDPVTFYYKAIWPKDTINFVSSNINPGQVIPAGRQIELIVIEDSEKDAAKSIALFGNPEDFQLEVMYKSVYDEVWRKKGMENPPEKIEE